MREGGRWVDGEKEREMERGRDAGTQERYFGVKKREDAGMQGGSSGFRERYA